MNLNELISEKNQVTLLNNAELEEISGGGNLFYDAGVATGVAIVQFCRWFSAVCEENKETLLYS